MHVELLCEPVPVANHQHAVLSHAVLLVLGVFCSFLKPYPVSIRSASSSLHADGPAVLLLVAIPEGKILSNLYQR